MKLKVVLAPAAKHHVRKLGAWWRRNREKAPTAFRDGMRRVRALIAEHPFVGEVVEDLGIEGLRRYPVSPTPYLVYFLPKVDEGLVIIEAVHSGAVKDGPELGDE